MMHSSNASSKKKKQGIVACRQLVSAELGSGTTKQRRTLASSKPKAESWILFIIYEISIQVLSTICVINICFYSVIYLFTLNAVLWWTKVLNSKFVIFSFISVCLSYLRYFSLHWDQENILDYLLGVYCGSFHILIYNSTGVDFFVFMVYEIRMKLFFFFPFFSLQFRSVAQSCPTLCDPMNRSTPGLPVHHQLPEFTQTQVHRVGDAIQPSHPLSSPSPPAPNPSQHFTGNTYHSFSTTPQYNLCCKSKILFPGFYSISRA